MGMRNVSGESTQVASTARQFSNGSMPLPPHIPKVRNGDMNSDIPIVASPWKPKPPLLRQPSDASRTTSASSHYHSRQTSASSRGTSSETKPVSKVKALAQAFNNLTAPKDSVKGRASSSGHKKNDSWTEKIRRSISGTSKKDQKEGKELKMTNEEVEPESPVEEAHKVEERGSKEADPDEAITKHIHEDEGKQPLLAMSPPGSPSMHPTEPQSLEEALDALGLGNDGRVSFQYSMDPSSSLHSRFATGGLMPGLEGDVHLANSPAGSPSMLPTEAPFAFPGGSGSTRLEGEDEEVFNNGRPGLEGEKKGSFLAPQLNRRSSSVYSRSENGGSPQKQAGIAYGAFTQPCFDNEDAPQKQPAFEKPLPATPLDSLRVHKRTTHTGSPSKAHKRSNATSPSRSTTPSEHHPRATSGINHSAYLSATPSTSQSVRTQTPAGIDHSAYLSHDYTFYLDTNFPVGATPPPIPSRNPARLARSSVSSQRIDLITALPVSRQDDAMDGAWDVPIPALSEPGAQGSRQSSGQNAVPTSPRTSAQTSPPPALLSQSWVKRLATSAHASASRNLNAQASRHSNAQNPSNPNNPNYPNNHQNDQELTEAIKTKAHAEGARSAAKDRLKREARDLGRFSERAAEGLVGKEQYAGESRGDDSFWI